MMVTAPNPNNIIALLVIIIKSYQPQLKYNQKTY
jgi:hypothetical protein